MLNIELIKNTLIIGIASSIITTSIVQKIKENLISNKKYIILVSFVSSLVVGVLFSKCFSSINWIYSVWAGLFSFIGADTLYQTFEDKIFKKFGDVENLIEIKRNDKEE